jgi:hypothetical protein
MSQSTALRLCRGKTADPSHEDIVAAERSLNRIRQQLAERKAEMQRAQVSFASTATSSCSLTEFAQPVPKENWFSGVMSTFRGNGGTHRSSFCSVTPKRSRPDLEQEIAGLDALAYQMSRNLSRLKNRQDASKFARTLKGRVFSWAGRLFAVYCMLRVLGVSNVCLAFRANYDVHPYIIQSIVNLFVPRRSSNSDSTYSDFITLALAYLVSLVPSLHLSNENIAVLSRQISLFFVGVIILTSVRMVLHSVARVRIGLQSCRVMYPP